MGAPDFFRFIAYTDSSWESYRNREENTGPVSAAAKTRVALALLRHARKLLREAGANKAAARVVAVLPSVEGATRHAALAESRMRHEQAKRPPPPRRRPTAGEHGEYLYSSAAECREAGDHLKSCDNDGYCNVCGEQDP